MFQHLGIPPASTSPRWQNYMSHDKGVPLAERNCNLPNGPSHKRKLSANVPYKFPSAVIPMCNAPCIKPKNATSSIQCCPEPPGDTDEVSAEGPSPPKCKKSITPASQETNETSHVTSHTKRERGSSMRSEGESYDSLGFLECSENLGDDKSSSSVMNDFCYEDSDVIKNTEENEDNNSALGIDTLNYLIGCEAKYAPDPYYMEKMQPHLTPKMRLILIDWMMEVCMEFTLKRETFHYACNYLDRFLSLVPSVEKSQLQLVGVTSLYIASKMEETYSPKVSDFAKSTDDGYTIYEIIQTEQTMMKTFKWELAAPTLNMWANWYMSQWDLYLQQSPYAFSHPLITSLPDPSLLFKTPTEKAYIRFREVMQLVDSALLDINYLQYQPRAIIASILYIVLVYHFGQASKATIAQEFPINSRFLRPEHMFNNLFTDFLGQSFGYQLEELLPTIQYIAAFMEQPFNYDLPTMAQDEVMRLLNESL